MALLADFDERGNAVIGFVEVFPTACKSALVDYRFSVCYRREPLKRNRTTPENVDIEILHITYTNKNLERIFVAVRDPVYKEASEVAISELRKELKKQQLE